MKILKMLGVCLMCLTMTFTFAGCSFPWSGEGTGGGGSGSSGNGGHNIQTGETTYPEFPGVDTSETEAQMAEYYDSITQGVRATYLPDVDEKTDDAVLQADRDKYQENAAYQYEVVATYILHTLQGEYGEGVSSSSLDYEFYADTSLLPVDDLSETTVDLPAITPSTGVSFRMETNANAIDAPVNGLIYQGETLTPVYDDGLAWVMNGATGFVSRYTQRVQANLMELALGLDLSSNASVQDIQDYAKQIEKLGIPQTLEYRNSVFDYIANNIIGSSLMTREDQTLTWTEPYYTTQHSRQVQTGVDSEGNPIYTTEYYTLYHYYDMSTGGMHPATETPINYTFTSATAYKFGYAETINEILDAVLGTFDSTGEQLTTGFTADFPTYTRAELTDVDTYRFYTSYNNELGEEERQVITTMDYKEYNSVVVYPKGTVAYDEEGNEVIDTEQPFWQFDMLTFCIDSINDITLDIYMRIHLNGQDTIIHLTRMNTDSTQDYDFESETENIEDWFYTENDQIIGYIPEFYFLEDKTNLRMLYLPDYLPEATTDLLATGIENTTNRTFYQDKRAGSPEDDGYYEIELENVYKNTFAGKLGSATTFDNAENVNERLTVNNFYGEIVDLSDKYLCQDECDFVEFIFDVVEDPTKPADYDYSFKFMIKAIFWGFPNEEQNN